MSSLRPYRSVRVTLVLAATIAVVMAVTAFCKRWPALQADVDRTLAVVAIILSVIAILLETRLHREFGEQQRVFSEHKMTFDKHSEEFKEQKSRIEEIVSSVTTRYLGDWPTNLRPIAELISNAKPGEDLVILVDIIGYGSYTRPDLYRSYLTSLTDAKRLSGTGVKILTCNESSAREGLKAEFSREDKDFRSPEHLEKYLLSHRLSQKQIDFYQLSPRYIDRLVRMPLIEYEDALNIHLFVDDTFYQHLKDCQIDIRIRSGPWIQDKFSFG
jgi:hypothetical protein